MTRDSGCRRTSAFASGGSSAWFLIDAVAQMDLSTLDAAYRADGTAGRRRAVVMSTLVSYAFGPMWARHGSIQRHCRQDVAYPVITATDVLDYGDDRQIHRSSPGRLAGLFSEVLRLCDQAGLVNRVVAINGTRLAVTPAGSATTSSRRSPRRSLSGSGDGRGPGSDARCASVVMGCPSSWHPGGQAVLRRPGVKLAGENESEELAEETEVQASADPEFEFDPDGPGSGSAQGVAS